MTYRAFTLVLPYYENPQMFREQQRVWAELTEDIRANLHVVVVDDCSPTAPAIDHVLPDTHAAIASFRVFRTKVDVRWNWLFCRNLGVEKATTDWVLLTDMDHVIPQPTWRKVMRERLDKMRAYRLSRVEMPDLKARDPHPNTWIMTRHMFLERVGGYDERLSGIYGTDGMFAGRVEEWALRVALFPEVAIVYPDSVIKDASTSTYQRKTDEDRAKRDHWKAEIRKMGTGYQPQRLTFPWEQVL